jgi:hypothetical protein
MILSYTQSFGEAVRVRGPIQKVARQLLDLFKTDSTARVWFLGGVK